ncbi:MAG TPA: CapA family protein [Bacteroidota bacterium]|nr:CapA family protein [Bacteroidota bacterium]
MKSILRFAFLMLWVAVAGKAQQQDSLLHATLLAVGDINLGRSVGQELLKGRVDYPFEKMTSLFHQADMVFANLESPISEQHGETQSPTSNIVFCAPPVAAASLRNAHITIVSTANNHEFDYGTKGLDETIQCLKEVGIKFAGTTTDSNTFAPAMLQCHGITIGVLAYTQLVNFHYGWRGRISLFDSARAAEEIRHLKQKVDVVIASFHGGTEYSDMPDTLTNHQLHWLAECGADLVLGHHPHVPQGVERYGQSWIVHSLGNAVFYQPQRKWAVWSFAAEFMFEKRNSGTRVSSIQLIPFRAGYQPTATISAKEADYVITRISKLSNVIIKKNEQGYFVENTTATSLH